MKKIANTAKQGRMDFTIFAVVILLCVFGLVMVLSSSYYYAYRQLESHDGFYYVKKQAYKSSKLLNLIFQNQH